MGSKEMIHKIVFSIQLLIFILFCAGIIAAACLLCFIYFPELIFIAKRFTFFGAIFTFAFFYAMIAANID